MRDENKTNPKMEMNTAKKISPMKVLVLRFCPRELKIRTIDLLPTKKQTTIRVKQDAMNSVAHTPKISQTPPEAVEELLPEPCFLHYLRLKSIKEYPKVEICRIKDIRIRIDRAFVI